MELYKNATDDRVFFLLGDNTFEVCLLGYHPRRDSDAKFVRNTIGKYGTSYPDFESLVNDLPITREEFYELIKDAYDYKGYTNGNI